MALELTKDKSAALPEALPGDPAYLKIRDLIYRISGIYHSEQKLYLLISSCTRRMTLCGAVKPSDYLEHLTIRPNRDAELRLLLNEITIGETYMFRHPAQLEALRTVILPQIMQAKTAIGLNECVSGRRVVRRARNPTHWPCFCSKKSS